MGQSILCTGSTVLVLAGVQERRVKGGYRWRTTNFRPWSEDSAPEQGV